MSKKHQQPSGSLPAGLPDDFFDSNKKPKKVQENDIEKEMEQFEREMSALQAESEEQLKDEFEKLQEERDLEGLDQKIDQWTRIIDLEKKAEELRDKPISSNPSKKFKSYDPFETNNSDKQVGGQNKVDEDNDDDLDDVEDFQDKLFDWRSKGL